MKEAYNNLRRGAKPSRHLSVVLFMADRDLMPLGSEKATMGWLRRNDGERRITTAGQRPSTNLIA
jgi:hypothetical protein